MDKPILHRRESLILTAIDVINEHGIQGLSIREVAKRQGISNTSIFSHFKSKNELVLAVLDHFSQYDSVIKEEVRFRSKQSKESILYCVDLFYTYYESYPAITAIIFALDVLRCEPAFSEKVKSILLSRNNCLKQLVENAQSLNQIRSDISSECIVNIIFGSSREVCLNWRMEDYSFPLKKRVLYTIQVLLSSFTPI